MNRQPVDVHANHPAPREMRRNALAIRNDASFVVQPQHFERDRRTDRVRRIGRAVSNRRAGGAPSAMRVDRSDSSVAPIGT